MLQAGVISRTTRTLMVEILEDNVRPRPAGSTGHDMPWAKLWAGSPKPYRKVNNLADPGSIGLAGKQSSSVDLQAPQRSGFDQPD